MVWRTRKKGSKKQQGKRFCTKQKPRSSFKLAIHKLTKKLRKLPPNSEIAVGAVIVCVPPVPDPSDIVGYGLIADGLRRRHNAKKESKRS